MKPGGIIPINVASEMVPGLNCAQYLPIAKCARTNKVGLQCGLGCIDEVLSVTDFTVRKNLLLTKQFAEKSHLSFQVRAYVFMLMAVKRIRKVEQCSSDLLFPLRRLGD